jgi:hypothetical protein
MPWTDESFPPLLLTVAFAGAAACMPPQNDTWWHLRLGSEMVASGRIISREILSHTATGTALFHNHEWLTQLLFYGLLRVGGPFLLTVVCAVFVLTAVLGAWRLVQGSADLRFVFLAVLMYGTATAWTIRPQVVSMALFVIAIHLIVKDREGWLPLLCLAWGNFHGAAVLGIAVAGCGLFEALLRSRARIQRSVLILMASVAALAVTPLGWHYLPRTFEVVRRARSLGLDEYRSAFELTFLPFWITVVILVVSFGRDRRSITIDRPTLVISMLALLLAIGGAMSVRNIPFFS